MRVLLWLALGLPACAPREPGAKASILLYTGAGASPGDVAAVKAILEHERLGYATATAAELNRMSDSALGTFRLLLVPGGNFIMLSDSLTPAATATIYTAVQQGLNYLGVCAGGFLAGDASYNSLRLAPGVQFGFYGAERQGVRKAAVQITPIGAPAQEHYWEDGPEFTGWGGVVARYPDSTPAIVQGRSGKGWVLLVGVHPEAPESWRRGMTFTTPASVDNEYAGTLIRAALEGRALAEE